MPNLKSSRGRLLLDREKRRGSVAVFSVFALVIMLGMIAFAIDCGYIVHHRTELQRTADSAAMAAANDLPDDTNATTIANTYVGLNHAGTNDVVPSSIVEVGVWDGKTATFVTPTPAFEIPNAVRVTVSRSQAGGNPINLFFGPLLGTSRADVTATATAILNRELCGPIIGIDWIKVPGNPLTDSYASADGPYDPVTAKNGGSLCSNGPIDVSGNAVVNGNSTAGKDEETDISGGAKVTGSLSERRTVLELAPVDATNAAIFNNNINIPLVDHGGTMLSPVDADGNFKLEQYQTIELPAGTYYFRDFKLASNSSVDLVGKTVLYITHDFDMAANSTLNNGTSVPSNLKILMTGGKAKLTADAQIYGILYAPNTDVTFAGDADLFGAVVGKTLTITGNSAVHYDEDLQFLPEIQLPATNHLVQ